MKHLTVRHTAELDPALRERLELLQLRLGTDCGTRHYYSSDYFLAFLPAAARHNLGVVENGISRSCKGTREGSSHEPEVGRKCDGN